MTNCPSIAELADFTTTGDPAFEKHVISCRRCRALVRLLDLREAIADDELSPRELHQVVLPRREAPSGELAFGEVCIVDTDFSDGTLLVCVVLDRSEGTPETVEVAPVSTDTHNASDWDLLLSVDDGPLGYPAMAEVWNHGTILSNQIVERIGSLAVDGQHRLSAIYEALLDDEAPPADVPRGVAVLADADPRTIFQEEEAERTLRFWQPSARVFAEGAPDTVATVGELLSRWLEREGYEPADYATEVGLPKNDVVLVAADRFEPQTFASERLVEAFRRTDIAHEEIEAALWKTIRPEHFASGSVIVEQRAYRRTAGRKGGERTEWSARGAAIDLPPEEQERRRKQYILDVLQGLEEKRGS